MKSTARLFIIGILFLPVAMLISTRLAELLLLTLVLLLVAWIGKAVWQSRIDEPARKARIAALLVAKPDYVVYGSGAPKWMGTAIFILFRYWRARPDVHRRPSSAPGPCVASAAS